MAIAHRLRKTLWITFLVLAGLLILLAVFLSPLVKWVVEKYDHKYTGRQITVDWVLINPLAGTVRLDDLRVYEQESDSVFFHASSIIANLNMTGLFRGEYVIEGLELDKPQATVIQYTNEKFNFSDLLEKFAGDKDSTKAKDSSEVKFSLLDIRINGGIFHLKEKMTPVDYFIKDVNVRSSGISWKTDTTFTTYTFSSGIGSGTGEGFFRYNLSTADYSTHSILRRFDLKIIEQYMKDMASYGSFSAMINADITAKGNLKDARNIDAVGGIGIYNFKFGKNEKEDFASFDKFVIKINHLNPKKNIYIIDSISLVKPFMRYEKYDVLDNIQHMFGKEGANVKAAAQSQQFNLVIAIADYVKLLARNFFDSQYKINRLGIYRGDLQYQDYSLNEKFVVALQPLTVVADSISSNDKRVTLRVNSGIKPYGNLRLSLSVNPKDSSDFELVYDLDKVNATLLNPFLVSYTSYPLDRGSIGFNGNWKVLNGGINSQNRLLIVDPRITDRIRANDNKWLPLKAIMFLVRERGNAIDYEIPITGNLKDPSFRLRDVLLDILGNVFIKPMTTRYRYEVRTVENSIEKTLAFNWALGEANLLPDAQAFVELLASFLKDNPGSKVKVFPVHYSAKEKEYLAFYEAKKRYYMQRYNKKSLAKEDIKSIQAMSVKDSLFVNFLDRQVRNRTIYTVQQKCAQLIGRDGLNQLYENLQQVRRKNFSARLEEQKLMDRVTILKDEEEVPFNGFSYYRITYDGPVPKELQDAFEVLEDFDTAKPRDKLLKEREKTRRFFNPKKRR